MKCLKCNTEITDGLSKCPVCGNDIEVAKEPVPETSVPSDPAVETPAPAPVPPVQPQPVPPVQPQPVPPAQPQPIPQAQPVPPVQPGLSPGQVPKKGSNIGLIIALAIVAFFGLIFVLAIVRACSTVNRIIDTAESNIEEAKSNVEEAKSNMINSDTNSNKNKESKLVENVKFSGYMCMDNQCQIVVITSNNEEATYYVDSSLKDTMKALVDYEDYSNYVKYDIYYVEEGSNKKIVDYKIYLKTTKEDLTSSAKTENDLRKKLGLFPEGTNTAVLTYSASGGSGSGTDENDKEYTFEVYIFKDSKNVQYKMRSINDNGSLKLTAGKQYTVTFEAKKGSFEYEYTLKSVK